MIKLKLTARNLYGTVRYFPSCDLSRAIASIRGRNNKTLQLEHINVLNAAGIKFAITDWNGEVTEL